MTGSATLASARRELERFGAALHEIRKARQLSLRALADQVAIDAGALSRIENGRLMPDPGQEDRLRRWMRAAP